MREEQVREGGPDRAEAQFRQLADSIPQLAWMARPDGWIYWYNRKWLEFTGKSPRELEGWGWREVHDPEHLPRVMEAWGESIRTGEPLDTEFPLRGADGVYRWFLTRVLPLRDEGGRIIRWFGTNTDITEQRESARRIAELNTDLRRRVEELEALLRLLPVGVFIASDAACTRISMNPAGAKMLGVPEEENPSKTGEGAARLPFTVQKDGREVAADELPMQRAARTGELVAGETFDVVQRDGGVRKLYEFAVPLRDETGSVRGCVGVFVDLTAEHRARLAQAESEARFRVMADRAPVLIWLSDAARRRTWFNRPWLAFVGRGMEEVVGFGWTRSIHPDDSERYLRVYEEAFEHRHEFQLAYRLRRHDGEYRWVLNHATPLFEPDGTFTGFVGSCVDITELEEARRLLQEHAEGLEQVVVERTEALQQSRDRLRIAERLASIGTLAAGIGHDLANLLLPVRVSLESIRLKGGPEVREDVETIQQSADYMSRLSSGLRLLAVDPHGAARTHGGTDLAEWWTQTSALMRNLPPRGVELKSDVTPGRAAISPAGLTQAVFNLVQNAAEAIRQSGRGTRITVSSRAADNAVVVEVDDDGPGMSEEVRMRCLDPFYTTKTRGLSTGLGLALVVGIISKAGGGVEVRSEKDKGSTFRLTLPAATPEWMSGPRPGVCAAVEVADARLRAFIVYELSTHGVEVRAGAEAGACELLVTDSPEEARLNEYLRAGQARRVLAVTDRRGLESDRVTILPPEFKSSAIRGELQRAIRALRGRAGGAGAGWR
ncbi:MAG: PAS domain S-box protein [Phycisphaerales bacterium]|nr:PAS domain S-box protein [Phycisphaerales bacterium]